jgi:DNA topoisomerase-1
MSWDVPTEFDCPSCGQTMFKKSGRGRMKPFCINESCENFLPEDKRGYRRKAAEADPAEEAPAEKKSAKKTPKKTTKKTTKKTKKES